MAAGRTFYDDSDHSDASWSDDEGGFQVEKSGRVASKEVEKSGRVASKEAADWWSSAVTHTLLRHAGDGGEIMKSQGFVVGGNVTKSTQIDLKLTPRPETGG
jgi:hypothetical protein